MLADIVVEPPPLLEQVSITPFVYNLVLNVTVYPNPPAEPILTCFQSTLSEIGSFNI
nr:hypothetical protein [Sedimentibacter sp.]